MITRPEKFKRLGIYLTSFGAQGVFPGGAPIPAFIPHVRRTRPRYCALGLDLDVVHGGGVFFVAFSRICLLSSENQHRTRTTFAVGSRCRASSYNTVLVFCSPRGDNGSVRVPILIGRCS